MSDEIDKLKLPCDKKDGRYVTLEDCNICIYNNKCDTFITLLDDSPIYIKKK